MKPIIMPQVGQDIPVGKIVEWLKHENDSVEKGELILTVESEKAVFEIEAEESGVLLRILHHEGEEVEILRPVGYIGQPGEIVGEQPIDGAEPSAVLPVGPADEVQAPSASASAEQRKPGKPLASPAVRRLAREKGVDLAMLEGSGPDGRITRDDVMAAEGAEPGREEVPGEGEETVVPFSAMRKEIARRLSRSKQNIPHFYMFADVDATDALKWQHSFNKREGFRLTITDLVVKATAVALRRIPRLNAHVEGERIVVRRDVNIGVAIAVSDGLLVPVIAKADKRSLREISELSQKNVAAARRGAISSGPPATFTISSMANYGVKQFIPIINPPECAILAVGAVERRVVPISGEAIAVRKMMGLTLACDHRAVDGADAAGLLYRIKKNLEGFLEIQEQWL